MRLCVTLVFICMMLSAVNALKCITCWGANPGTCNQVWNCPDHYDRCATTIAAENMVTKECMRSDMCSRVYSMGVSCCAEDLCNGAKLTRVFVPFLLASISITALFI